MNKFDKELVELLQKEETHFDMANWTRPGQGFGMPSCETAACMAGHIAGTLRPELAKQLITDHPEAYGYNTCSGEYRPMYLKLARAIYFRETGKRCTLDFFGTNSDKSDITEITREEAIAHIRGRSKRWPRIKAGI